MSKTPTTHRPAPSLLPVVLVCAALLAVLISASALAVSLVERTPDAVTQQHQVSPAPQELVALIAYDAPSTNHTD